MMMLARKHIYQFSRLALRQIQTLKDADPVVYALIQEETKRQREGINLIPSENHSSRAILESLGSVMSTKYAEGNFKDIPALDIMVELKYSIKWNYSANRGHQKQAFSLDAEKWGVNVQSLSGSPANFAIYTGLLQPTDRMMSLDLPHGGHLSHGYQTDTKKISAVSTYFEVLPYRLNEETELIDYDKLASLAQLYRPKLIVAGASAYARLIDFQAIRKICDSVNAYLLADVSHTAGLMAAEQMPSPFPHADVVMTTTHKSLRGPRGALIFYRQGVKGKDKSGKDVLYDLKQKIDSAVFPALQGGPHFHTITGITVALDEATTPEFKEYQRNVLINSKRMAEELMKRNYVLVSSGTDNHLVLVNLKTKQIDGARVESMLEYLNITANKNTVPKDKSALVPNGLRMGAVPMTSRGLRADDFSHIVEFIDRGTNLALKAKAQSGPKVADFKKWIQDHAAQDQEIEKLKKEVCSFATQFPLPGVDY